ncbi:MAG: tetratricopeptide repeat protein [Gemmatimonadales bacterium]|nr:MAG: tetratricopeptide repeat protein [Gemmatimonadales bacterium]
MATQFWKGAVLVLLPAVAVAQDADIRQRVIDVQPVRFESSDCFKTGHFSVRGATAALKTASESEANRERLLGDARTSLVRAIEERDQEKNAGAWFYLGRTYLNMGDVVGADSAFTRAEVLAPECAAEVTDLRRRTWLAIAEVANLHVQEQRVDSAVVTYRLALRMYRGEPRAYSNMGTIFELAEEPDSALTYFRFAANMDTRVDGKPDPEIGRATRRMAQLFAEGDNIDSAGVYLERVIVSAQAANDSAGRDAATSALGRIMFQAQRYPEALSAFKRLAEWRPRDDAAKRNLASIYQAAGHSDSAQAILTALGETVPVAQQVDTNAAPYLINRGAGKYQQQQFEAAAKDFERAVMADPSNRIALTNLALTYNELKNGAKLVATAKRSIARDPFHELSHRFLVQGYVFLEEKGQAQTAVAQLDALPIFVDSLTATPLQGGRSVRGVALNKRKSASAAMVLVFEFVGADGAVISSNEVALESIPAGGSSVFTVEGGGSGIVDWRYRKK